MIKKNFKNHLLEISFAVLVISIIFDSSRNLANFGILTFNFAVLGTLIIGYIIYWYHHRSKKIHLNLIFDDDVNEVGMLLNKIITPFLLFFSTISYSHFNISKTSFGMILLGQFLIFWLYFINVKSFFSKEENREQSTDVVYDLFKLLIYFLLIDVLLNLVMQNEISFSVSIFLSFCLHITLSFLMIFRLKHIKSIYFGYSMVISCLLCAFYILVTNLLNLNIMLSSFMLLVMFYLLHGLLFRYIYKKLNKDTLIEFGSILLLVLTILFFLR
jgi:hypothetical protein